MALRSSIARSIRSARHAGAVAQFSKALRTWSAPGKVFGRAASERIAVKDFWSCVTHPSMSFSSYHAAEVAPDKDYEKLVPDLFREAAKKYPDQMALEGAHYKMTYAELDAATDVLAAFLRKNYQAVPEKVVGVYMERCEEYVVAILAIWKSGAAYCPIELAYPGPLLEAVFAEVNPAVVLTKDTYTKNIPQSTKRFVMGKNWQAQVAKQNVDIKVLEEHPATLDSLAYVIYSGGSTGRPKGIEAPLKSPVASYLWRNSISGYGPGARAGCNVFFVWEIFRPLLRGGTTVVIPDDVIFDMGLLGPYIREKALTEVLFTPSLFETLIDTSSAEDLKGLPLEVVWLNGEVVTTTLLQKAMNWMPQCALFNTYSISECGEVCAGPLSLREDCPKFSPVGHLASFARHVLMDPETQEPVPHGEPGELWVSGPGVGRGYTNNPKKTEEAFVTHKGERFYRTGDLARELHDGVFEILGRCDFMVKVRGYSVVLGLVEAAISKTIGVSMCCVVAKGEEGSDKRIVAYLVAASSAEIAGRVALGSVKIDEYGRCPDIFQELQKELPHYAIPSVYMVLESLPINPTSTKLNRAALPPPPAPPAAAEIPEGFVFDGRQASIRWIFEEVLGLPFGALSKDSNFFEFGGHSLLATQLMSRIKALGGPQVNVADFLQAPTPDGLAKTLRGETAEGEAHHLPTEVAKFTKNWSDKDIGLAKAYWRSSQHWSARTPQRVFLTGATGYVGAHLLAYLISTLNAQVLCIVRASSQKEAHARVIQNLEEQGISGIDLSRLQVIPGDVSLPHLGMDTDEYMFMQQFVDVVIHAAAIVNLAYPYSLLEAANVQGTANIIEFAIGGRLKALHYISTDGIFPEKGDPGIHREDEVPPHELLHTGYAQTKWVSEQLVESIRKMGLPTVIYRIGNVSGPQTGSGWNANDSNLLFLRACLERKAVPMENWQMEFTPVDFLTKFIGNCLTDLEIANGKTYHLINSHKLSLDEIANFANKMNFSVQRVDRKAWCKTGNTGADDIISIVLGEEALESLLGRHPVYDQTNVELACEHFGLSYPKANGAKLDKYVPRLIEEGLLPKAFA